MIAASIPIIVPAFRWIREKLSEFRYAIASWVLLSKKSSKRKDSLEGRDQITLIMTNPQKMDDV